MNREILINNGINCNRAIERCADNEELFETILRRFVADGSNFGSVLEAFRSADYKTVHDLVHEIKGVSGNLEFSQLFAACCNVLTELRNERYSSLSPLLQEYDYQYTAVIDTINKALNE